MKQLVRQAWPELRFEEWKETLATVHLWTQVAGKIRLAHEPHLNHFWEVALYVTPQGLTTSTMPYGKERTFTIDFDFVNHLLAVRDCDGGYAHFALRPMSVAEFYALLMDTLDGLGLHTAVRTMPSEIAEPTPFEVDTGHCSYDKRYVERFARVLIQADRLCKMFRARFIGKASPVHFFWGGFDLAVTRFSGRAAPPHPGGIPNLPDWITRESYSHEVSSCGFWPGGYGLDAMFYAYAYPQPEGFAQAPIHPADASYNTQLREFLLPYEAVRSSADRDGAVLAFFQSAYEAAADLGKWDRKALERR